jgi:hypothetical protein
LKAEETIINGDPAIKINSHAKPDFAIEDPDIFISPSLITIAQDSFDVKIILHNLGRYEGDSLSVSIKRSANSNAVIKDTIVKVFGAEDSLFLKLPFYRLHSKVKTRSRL